MEVAETKLELLLPGVDGRSVDGDIAAIIMTTGRSTMFSICVPDNPPLTTQVTRCHCHSQMHTRVQLSQEEEEGYV